MARFISVCFTSREGTFGTSCVGGWVGASHPAHSSVTILLILTATVYNKTTKTQSLLDSAMCSGTMSVKLVTV